MAISPDDIGKRFVITVRKEASNERYLEERMLCFLTDHNGRPCSVPIMGAGYVAPLKYCKQEEAAEREHQDALDSLASMLNHLANQIRNGEIRIAYNDQGIADGNHKG